MLASAALASIVNDRPATGMHCTLSSRSTSSTRLSCSSVDCGRLVAVARTSPCCHTTHAAEQRPAPGSYQRPCLASTVAVTRWRMQSVQLITTRRCANARAHTACATCATLQRAPEGSCASIGVICVQALLRHAPYTACTRLWRRGGSRVSECILRSQLSVEPATGIAHS